MYYASAVLADGRVFVAGGEYNGGSDEVELDAAEIYDPVADAWMDLPTPAGWAKMGDASSCVLGDGRVLVGNLDDQRTAFFQPGPDTWSAGPQKNDQSAEESWALLQDGTVLTVECSNGQETEKYVPDSNQWVSAGQTPSMLVETASSEIGPSVLLPDGRCFFVGATGKTALYTPGSVPSDLGTWTPGPDFPQAGKLAMGAKDAPGCLLPNGHCLCVVAPVDGQRDNYLTPTSFFEFDGTNLVRVPDPPNNGSAPYFGRLLVIPSGQVLFSAGTPEIYVYTPDGSPDDAWRPMILDCPGIIRAGSSFVLNGRQFNGLSQASMYGDDGAMATNYPIVRLTTASGHIVFCRTLNHSTMAVATGSTVVHTSVEVPSQAENGPAELVVVANGIASAACPVTVVGGLTSKGRGNRKPPVPDPMPVPRLGTAARGVGRAIGLGVRYISCGFYYACNWAAQLTCTKTETEAYQQCTQTREDGYNQCTQTRDNGYNQCTQTRDDGYNQCAQTRDEGYNQCCDWAPCSWFCDAWVWVSNIVCVAWTWVSNIVCVAWTWISNIVCVAWTWISYAVCVAWAWIVATVCISHSVYRLHWGHDTHLLIRSGAGGPDNVPLNENCSDGPIQVKLGVWHEFRGNRTDRSGTVKDVCYCSFKSQRIRF
jgi:hypothetical protein